MSLFQYVTLGQMHPWMLIYSIKKVCQHLNFGRILVMGLLLKINMRDKQKFQDLSSLGILFLLLSQNKLIKVRMDASIVYS